MVSYNERHKIPTVKEYREIEAERERASAANESQLAETEADEKATPADSQVPNDDSEPKASGGGQEEKDRIKEQMSQGNKPKAFKAKGER
jgi:hypothetical protein